MRAFLVWMAIVNVGLAAYAGYLTSTLLDLDVHGQSAFDAETVQVYGIAFSVFCLIASALPIFLFGRGKGRLGVMLSVLPVLTTVALYVGVVFLQAA